MISVIPTAQGIRACLVTYNPGVGSCRCQAANPTPVLEIGRLGELPTPWQQLSHAFNHAFPTSETVYFYWHCTNYMPHRVLLKIRPCMKIQLLVWSRRHSTPLRVNCILLGNRTATVFLINFPPLVFSFCLGAMYCHTVLTST